jgi:hypothetical protein
MSGADDVDVVGLDLVEGDVLTVALKSVPGVKRAPFVLSLDLARPSGERLVAGRYPATLKTPGIKGLVAPATGRYLLIVLHADDVGTALGTYSLKVAVRHARANASGKGTAAAGEFSFDAAAGSAFVATLKGAGLDPASVRVEGPDGGVPATPRTKRGKVTIGPVGLPPVTGTYTVRFTATGAVTFTWGAILPKASARLRESAAE